MIVNKHHEQGSFVVNEVSLQSSIFQNNVYLQQIPEICSDTERRQRKLMLCAYNLRVRMRARILVKNGRR